VGKGGVYRRHGTFGAYLHLNTPSFPRKKVLPSQVSKFQGIPAITKQKSFKSASEMVCMYPLCMEPFAF
jgi:hypothetical protein